MNPEISDENFFDFKCPYCGAVNSFPSSNVDTVAECVNCLNTFIVPPAGDAVGRKLPFPIETPKTRIRRFEPADWEALATFAFDSEDEAQHWVQSQSHLRLTSSGQTFTLGIEEKGEGKLVGRLGLRFLDDIRRQVEVSIDTADGYDGLESEVIEAALELCFQDLHVHRVCAQCFSDDEESCRLFPAVGMRKEAEFRENLRFGDTWRSTCWFALLEKEYTQQ